MQLVKWNPARDIFGMPLGFNRLFDDFFSPATPHNGTSLHNWEPRVDVYEDKESYFIDAELPGMDKKDITVDLDGGILTLKAERSAENEVKDENFYRRERACGKYERAFRMPEEIDTGKIAADYKDGVLKIRVPKTEKPSPQKITVH